MILEKVIINNFQSIKEATVYLKDRSLSSIAGTNLDGNGADSNGSGKSTLINAILWCNYGDAGKDLSSVDDVISSGAKSCSVESIWFDEQLEIRYSITRYRKDPKYKNMLTVIQESGLDETKGTDKETQLVVNQILGGDQLTFEAACFARQDDAPDIPGMTDGELKSLLERVLPFDDMTVYFAKANKNVIEQTQLISELERDFERISVKLDTISAESVRNKIALDGWEELELKRKETISNDIAEISNKIFNLSSSLKPQDKIDTYLKSVQKKIDGFSLFAYGKIKERYINATKAHEKANYELSKIDSLTSCNKCGQAIGDREAITASLETAKLNAAREYNEAKVELDNNAVLYQNYLADKEVLSNLEKVNRNQAVKIAEISRLKDRTEALATQRDVDQPNPHIAALRRLGGEFSALQTESFNIDKQLENERNRLQLLKEVSETFSPKGLRYHFLETVTPKLNQDTNKYLSQLTDGGLIAQWSTVTKLKSGDYREKFSIAVTGQKCKGYGSLSGGEKRKVKLACFFALQDLIASRATKEIKLWCADEIDHALDSSGLERLMNLLYEKASTKGTILVISHNELSSWIPNSTLVTKENGVSTITGYLNER